MRPKVVISVLVFGLVAVAAVLFLWLRSGGGAAGAPPQETSSQTTDAGTAGSGPVVAVRPRATSSNEESKPEAVSPGQTTADSDDPLKATPEAKHQAYVEARAAELMDLASADDSDSLNTILSELGNRDPEIRKAALEAAVQFGSRDAIPKLEDAELQADDPHERAAIADAIEFLQLPSLSETRAQNSAQPKSNP
jgi:hypothetical protein